MKMIRQLLLLAVPLALCLSCSKEGPGADTMPAGIRFETELAPVTRVTTGADFRSAWETGDEIGMYAVPNGQPLAGSGNALHNVKLTWDGTSWTGDVWWPNTGQRYDFYAYYPYDELQDDPTALVFSVMTDQRGETDGRPNYDLSELLGASSDNNGAGYAKGEVVKLRFSHIMAMVQVEVDGTGIVARPDELSVTLYGVLTETVFNLGGLTTTAQGPKEDITMHRVERPCDADYTSRFTFRALVPAQTVEQGKRLFFMDNAGQDEMLGAPLAADLTLTAGQAELFGMAPEYEDYLRFIPDPNFRQYCFDNFDTDLNGQLSLDEVLAVEDINVNGKGILSLEGVRYFSNLQTLECSFNYSLESLDVTGCANLQTLNCRSNSLSTLNVSGCLNLEWLNCTFNSLESLNVSGCAKLQNLNCYFNSLTSLDVSGCPDLQELDCYTNSLESLDVSGCAKLQTLKCHDNYLSSLDISECPQLTTLDCGGSDIPLTVLTYPSQGLGSLRVVAYNMDGTTSEITTKDTEVNKVTVRDKQ